MQLAILDWRKQRVTPVKRVSKTAAISDRIASIL
jgi:hypothetical protein